MDPGEHSHPQAQVDTIRKAELGKLGSPVRGVELKETTGIRVWQQMGGGSAGHPVTFPQRSAAL